ncbi:MAG: thiolase family protein, partial [Deltaproteobacteria bacterium]|nr:thiolase family protein [Deltaproteobacteria bacterium]
TARTTKILAEVIEKNERSVGASMPALAAMITRRYQHDSGLSPERLQSILCRVAIKNHYNGSLNPYAQFRKLLSEADYQNSKWVSTPLHTYDCAPITDGAVAVLLTAEKKRVRIAGVGHATDTLAVRHRDSLTSFRSTRLAAYQAYNMAKVNLAEVHDAFTMFEIIGTEDLGFFPPKQGWMAVEEGVTSIQGKLPINPSGGLKARGHPVGASGLAQIAEVVWQLRGEVEARRQVPGARIGLTQNIGGLANNNLVVILERTDRYRAIPTYWKPAFDPGTIESKENFDTPPTVNTGTVETFTTLFTTPEGIPSPLTLAFVRTDVGQMILTRAREQNLSIGQQVQLEKDGDLIYSRPLPPSGGLQEGFKRWLRGTLTLPKRKEDNP